MSGLPYELRLQIGRIGVLAVRDLARLARSCRGWAAVVRDDALWHALAVHWDLAEPVQALDEARPPTLPQLDTWKQLVLYHDLVEQQFGYDLTGACVPGDLIRPAVRLHESPLLYPHSLPAPAHFDDGCSLRTCIPAAYLHTVWPDCESIPFDLYVVDTITGHVLSHVPRSRDRDRLTLVHAKGYLAFTPHGGTRARTRARLSTTFYRLETHLPVPAQLKLGHAPRRGHFAQTCTFPFVVDQHTFAPPLLARWTGRNVLIYNVDTGEMVRKTAIVRPLDLSSRYYRDVRNPCFDGTYIFFSACTSIMTRASADTGAQRVSGYDTYAVDACTGVPVWALNQGVLGPTGARLDRYPSARRVRFTNGLVPQLMEEPMPEKTERKLRDFVSIDHASRTLVVSFGRGDTTVVFKNYPRFFGGSGLASGGDNQSLGRDEAGTGRTSTTCGSYIAYITGLALGVFGSQGKRMCNGRLLARHLCVFSWAHARSPLDIRLARLRPPTTVKVQTRVPATAAAGAGLEDRKAMGQAETLVLREARLGASFLTAHEAAAQLYVCSDWSGRSPAGWLSWSFSDHALERMGLPTFSHAGPGVEVLAATPSPSPSPPPSLPRPEPQLLHRHPLRPRALRSGGSPEEGTLQGAMKSPATAPLISADDMDDLLSLFTLLLAPFLT